MSMALPPKASRARATAQQPPGRPCSPPFSIRPALNRCVNRARKIKPSFFFLFFCFFFCCYFQARIKVPKAAAAAYRSVPGPGCACAAAGAPPTPAARAARCRTQLPGPEFFFVVAVIRWWWPFCASAARVYGHNGEQRDGAAGGELAEHERGANLRVAGGAGGHSRHEPSDPDRPFHRAGTGRKKEEEEEEGKREEKKKKKKKEKERRRTREQEQEEEDDGMKKKKKERRRRSGNPT